jgi:hypothetical protein
MLKAEKKPSSNYLFKAEEESADKLANRTIKVYRVKQKQPIVAPEEEEVHQRLRERELIRLNTTNPLFSITSSILFGFL